MKKVLVISIFLILSVFIGCGDNAVTNPVEGDNGKNDKGGKITLSGAVTGSYDVTGAALNNGDKIIITLANKEGDISVALTSQQAPKTGTFSVPDKYSVVYLNQKDTVMVTMNTGSVKIEKIGQLSATGSFTASGYVLKMSTGKIDSSKIITVNGTFSLAPSIK